MHHVANVLDRLGAREEEDGGNIGFWNMLGDFVVEEARGVMTSDSSVGSRFLARGIIGIVNGISTSVSPVSRQFREIREVALEVELCLDVTQKAMLQSFLSDFPTNIVEYNRSVRLWYREAKGTAVHVKDEVTENVMVLIEQLSIIETERLESDKYDAECHIQDVIQDANSMLASCHELLALVCVESQEIDRAAEHCKRKSRQVEEMLRLVHVESIREARNHTKRAQRLRNEAERARSRATTKGIGGSLLTVGLVVAAPFTMGVSLIPAAGTAAVTGAMVASDVMDASKCEERAEHFKLKARKIESCIGLLTGLQAGLGTELTAQRLRIDQTVRFLERIRPTLRLGAPNVQSVQWKIALVKDQLEDVHVEAEMMLESVLQEIRNDCHD